MAPLVSIIVRTRNEQRWLTSCLEGVFAQSFKDFEVIIVDNQSSDQTLAKAERFPVKVVSVDRYRPGLALNVGVRNSQGRYFVCLSAHCVPVDSAWLQILVESIQAPGVAGVYGRQEPLPYSSDKNKLDLLVTFGLDPRVHIKDTFFHNANSIVDRQVWERFPFDEQATNIEDRIWAKQVLDAGYRILYEPRASVYHYHGIHQDGNDTRCESVVRILERELERHATPMTQALESLNVVTVTPVKGPTPVVSGRPLLQYTLARAKESTLVKHAVVAADNQPVLDLAQDLGADLCLLRPPELSQESVELMQVFRFALDQLTARGIQPDVLVFLSQTYPFRPKNLIDELVARLVGNGFDSVMPALRETRSCWTSQQGRLVRLDQGFMPSALKNPLYVGLSGLGTASYVDVLNSGRRLGDRVGLAELDDLVYGIDTNRGEGLTLAEGMLAKWWEENS